ncbi:hypothetical protein Q31a_37770 [Aureliella helgolandensis]|uniref:Uncharacterized protein n=1 Tax=Aureliella helgolandensis TaxID=2527968 RepID=A0A518GA33_9BACT|nr:hypothetical protein Q31a_37770 [Aureliella helgolandensis]
MRWPWRSIASAYTGPALGLTNEAMLVDRQGMHFVWQAF